MYFRNNGQITDRTLKKAKNISANAHFYGVCGDAKSAADRT